MVLLVIAFGIGFLALQWFMSFAAILAAIAAVVGLVCWGVWVVKNRA